MTADRSPTSPPAADPNEAPTVPDLQPGLPAGPPIWADGEYELLEELGRGGMGVVYRAVQRRAGRVVALKLIRTDLLTAAAEDRKGILERFRREAQAAARVEHEHVVAVYDVGESGGVPYYAMRYVPGRSLAAVLRDGPLEGKAAAALMEPVARAVQSAHEHGLLHRDLKPANILVDQGGKPYVSDFGLAKWQEAAAGMTHAGTCLGTPSYMAPEQAEDAAAVTAACDVYSLGATLYALVTGRPPFQAATPTETLHQLKYREPAAPRALNPAIDRDLETIVLKCLRKDPAARYTSAGELADDLRRYRVGEPIRARPVPAWERAWRWCRRNRALALTGAAAILALLTVAVVSTWAAIHTDRLNADLKGVNLRLEGANAELARERNLAAEAAAKLRDEHAEMARRARELMKAAMPKGEQLRLEVLTPQSEALVRLAVEAGRRAVQLFPRDVDLRAGLADSYYLLGTVYREKRQPEQMKAAWQSAVGELEAMARLAPKDLRIRVTVWFLLGRTCCNLGLRAGEEKDHAEAVRWHSRALANLEQKLLLMTPEGRWFACAARLGRGEALLAMGKPGEALPDWRRALQLADAGQAREAITAAEESLVGKDCDAEDWKFGAAVFALAAGHGRAGSPTERERWARQAIAYLKQARAGGAFGKAGAADALASDADFRALRAREDFRAFLRSLPGR